MMQKTLLIFLACLLVAGKAHAQKEANIWYFGDGLVWNFPEVKPKVSPQSKLNTSLIRPSFTMSDSLGNLQFYTDGISVWNAKHEAITQNLNGEMAIVATPYPQKKGFYCLFHVGILPAEKRTSFARGDNSSEYMPEKTAVFKLYYSLLDVNANKMVEENVLVLENVLSDICIARHADKGKYWLIAHLNKSNNFLAYPITAKGFGKEEGKVSTIGKQYQTSESPQFAPHLLKTTILGTKVLIARMGALENFEIYDFDNKVGSFYNMCVIKLKMPYLASGCEFSPNGRFVYVAVISSAVHVIQYDLKSAQSRNGMDFIDKSTDGGFTVDVSNQKEATNYVYRFHMQLAPNGNIYLSGVAPITILKNNQPMSIKSTNTRMLEAPDKPYRMPNITHLIPTGFALEGTTAPIEVGKPFVREILFDSNQSILKTQYENSLQDIVAYLLKNPKATIEIAGHTDNEGEETKNQKLSQDRAQALANFLINKGIGKERIKAVGYGSSKPIAENTSPVGKAKNRRIEFLIGG